MKQEGGIQVAQIPTCDMPVPAQVEMLKERAKTEMVPPPPPPPDSAENKIRSIEEVSRKGQG
jgi:hypothetical protein